jgi:hypothetical protein
VGVVESGLASQVLQTTSLAPRSSTRGRFEGFPFIVLGTKQEIMRKIAREFKEFRRAVRPHPPHST